MILFYHDVLTDEPILSEDFLHREILGGMLWEVDAKWVIPEMRDYEKRLTDATNSKIPINLKDFLPQQSDYDWEPTFPLYRPLTDADDPARKRIDIVRHFTLVELPRFDTEQFVLFIKQYGIRVAYKLEEEKRKQFRKGIREAANFLLSMFDQLQFYATSPLPRGSMIFAYHKDNAPAPTFLYFAHGLKRYEFYKKPLPLETESPSGPLIPLPSCCLDLDLPNTYQDVLSGDIIFSDMFPHKEIEDGMLWEVEGKWVYRVADHITCKQRMVELKVINIVEMFRLKELVALNAKQFKRSMTEYIVRLLPELAGEKKEKFEKGIMGIYNYLLSKLMDFKLFKGGSMLGSLIFAYYKVDATDPTFLYLAHGLKRGKRTWA